MDRARCRCAEIMLSYAPGESRMAEKILLLGHGKNAGLALAGTLAGLGFQPAAATWKNFAPKPARNGRPDLIIADVDQPAAWPMPKLADTVRRLWGDAFPVIAASNASKFQTVSKLLDDGASAVLPKSPPIELLARKIVFCLSENTPPPVNELTEEVPVSLLGLFAGNSRLVRLGDLVSVYTGATPRQPRYRRMAPPDQEWRGVLTSDVLDRFHIGKPTSFLSWNRFHLFRMPPPAEYSVAEKVLLRRAGPPLAAAVDRSRLPAGTDVYSLVPYEGIAAGYIACLLNSRLLDFYFNRLANLGPGGRLRPEDIREAPVPPPNRTAQQELVRIASLLSHYGPNPEGWIDRQNRDELWEGMEEAVFRLYGAGHEVREGLEALHF